MANLRISIFNGEMVFNRLLGNGWSDLDDFFLPFCNSVPLIQILILINHLASSVVWAEVRGSRFSDTEVCLEATRGRQLTSSAERFSSLAKQENKAERILFAFDVLRKALLRFPFQYHKNGAGQLFLLNITFEFGTTSFTPPIADKSNT